MRVKAAESAAFPPHMTITIKRIKKKRGKSVPRYKSAQRGTMARREGTRGREREQLDVCALRVTRAYICEYIFVNTRAFITRQPRRARPFLWRKVGIYSLWAASVFRSTSFVGATTRLDYSAETPAALVCLFSSPMFLDTSIGSVHVLRATRVESPTAS